jgi:uncharacterized protein Veg
MRELFTETGEDVTIGGNGGGRKKESKKLTLLKYILNYGK